MGLISCVIFEIYKGFVDICIGENTDLKSYAIVTEEFNVLLHC